MNTTKEMSLITALAMGAILLSLFGCSEKPRAEITTMETVKAQAAVDAYDTTGSKSMKLQSEKAFAELAGEIRELEIRVENTTGDKRAEASYKLTELKKRESEIRADFNEAKFDALIEDIKGSIR